jgi:hypothetical protein
VKTYRMIAEALGCDVIAQNGKKRESTCVPVRAPGVRSASAFFALPNYLPMTCLVIDFIESFLTS